MPRHLSPSGVLGDATPAGILPVRPHVTRQGSRRIRPAEVPAAAALALVMLLANSARAGEPPTPPDEAYRFEETVDVTDTRLRDEPTAARRVPANVTVLGRAEIEASGADTLQDLLAIESGAVLFDQVGNDVGKTLDLRGFNSGTGTRVFLDGAPLNDTRNNALALELVPLSSLGRVEITRGSVAALAGGGSEAGVINLWTRRPESEGSGGALAAAAGELGTRELRAEARHRRGGFDALATGARFETEGFRSNSDGELTRLSATLGWSPGERASWRLSAIAGDSDFGTPGALTTDELAADRTASPFNALDFAVEKIRQAALNFQGGGRATGLSANLFSRGRDSEILTTGRSAPSFGGFLLDSSASALGAALQSAWHWGGTDAAAGGAVTAGLEWLDGTTDAAGFATPPGDLARVDRATPSSDNATDRETLGLFAQASWQPAAAWSVLAGLRYDRDQVGYRERVPDPANAASREYSELSARLGVTWRAAERLDLYASAGEAFLPPTVEELFSFPRFGSNPELRPEDSRSLEIGLRRRFQPRSGPARLDVALFEVETSDEIVFDPFSPLGLFGANVNAGEARRRGVELSARGFLSRRSRYFVNATRVEAELTAGPNAGGELPLVPGERLAAGVDVELGRAVGLRVDGLYVGEQVLSNDEANAVPKLGAYSLFHARLRWQRGALTLWADARNLLDEEYSTRGIYAFDFSSFTNEVFLTPAPGRRLTAGVEWEF